METDCTLGRNIRFSGALEYKMSECQIGQSSIINKGNLIILGLSGLVGGGARPPFSRIMCDGFMFLWLWMKFGMVALFLSE